MKAKDGFEIFLFAENLTMNWKPNQQKILEHDHVFLQTAVRSSVSSFKCKEKLVYLSSQNFYNAEVPSGEQLQCEIQNT
jgi:hypothetical protein